MRTLKIVGLSFIGVLVLLFAVGFYFAARDTKSEDWTVNTSTASQTPKTREELIAGYFHAFNNSNHSVVNAVKASLSDPDSFDHVKTEYWDQGKTIRVKMDFKAKNGMNAIETAQAWADLNPEDGSLLKWGLNE